MSVDRSGNARIRVKVMAVLLDPTRTRHLVWVGHDPLKDPAHFHRLLGGHLEFGESTLDGIIREIAEEAGSHLLDPRLLDVVESRYVHEGRPGHEIVFVYAGRLADPDVVPPEGGTLSDNGEPIRVAWRPVADADEPLALYPDGVADLAWALADAPAVTMDP